MISKMCIWQQKYCEQIWNSDGPEFGSDEGKIMTIVQSLYGLRSNGAAFKILLAKTLDD